MRQEKLWKKWLLIIIWVAILIIGTFVIIELNWAKNTAVEKWNDIKNDLNQWWLMQEDVELSDENTEWKTYSIFHEGKQNDEDKYKDLEYNFGNYDDYETENYDINGSNDYNYNYDNDYNY